MASSTSPFTYEAVEVIFGSIYFYFHIQTAPNLQDCPHSDNLPTIPETTLRKSGVILLKEYQFFPKKDQNQTTFWSNSRPLADQ